MDRTIKVYARQDANGNVIQVFSDVFEKPEVTDILIKEGHGDEYAHAQAQYQLFDIYGRCNYKIVDGTMTEVAEADKPSIPAPEPTAQERLEALEAAMLEVILGG